MSTIPKTRAQLVGGLETSFNKLLDEIEEAGKELPDLNAVDDWSVKDLMAVRLWWTEAVIKWIETGKKGKKVVTPAKGFSWDDTPALNEEIIKNASEKSFKSIVNRLTRNQDKIMATIAGLNDRQLLDAGTFDWAGEKWPVARWISDNTTTQYTSARTMIRKAKKNK